MTEEEFHKARRVFAVKNGTVLLAPPNMPLTHREWLQGLFGVDVAKDMLDTQTRGYVLGDRLVAYTAGDKFSHWVNHADVLAALTLFSNMAGVEIKEVGLGAVPGTGQPWQPRVVHDAKDYYSNVLKWAEKQKG